MHELFVVLTVVHHSIQLNYQSEIFSETKQKQNVMVLTVVPEVIQININIENKTDDIQYINYPYSLVVEHQEPSALECMYRIPNSSYIHFVSLCIYGEEGNRV